MNRPSDVHGGDGREARRVGPPDLRALELGPERAGAAARDEHPTAGEAHCRVIEARVRRCSRRCKSILLRIIDLGLPEDGPARYGKRDGHWTVRGTRLPLP